MVELTANGKGIDLENKGNDIKYTKQIADIFDIASVQSSYTNSFTVPKTANNTQVFKGLGIVADTSDVPYVKTNASLKNQGFSLVNEGLLNVSETTESYKVSVINGVIELFKLLENKTIGSDLDLSQFNHEKNTQTVINSINNNFYKYIVADYGGKVMNRNFLPPFNYAINIDYLVPSFSVVKILELIFSTFGITVDYAGISNFIDGLFITYPKPPQRIDSEAITSANLVKGNHIAPYIQVGNIWRNSITSTVWDSGSTANEGNIYGERYVFPQSSIYDLNIKIKGYALYRGTGIYIGSEYKPFTVSVEIDNYPILQFQSDPYEIVERDISVFINGGSEVTVKCFVNTFQYTTFNNNPMRLREFHINSNVLNIKRVNQGNVSLSNAMKSFKITDFLKEIIWRTAVTPIIDEDKVLKFIPIENRLNRDTSIDFTDKYVRRTSEKYLKASYARINRIAHKYNTDGTDISDGILVVNNENIEAEKVLAQSQMYSPETFTSSIRDRNGNNVTQVPVLTMFTKEIKDESEDGVNIEYKALDNRYFFTRFVINEGNWRYSSNEVTGSGQNVSQIMVANTSQTLFSELVPSKYQQYQKIFDSFRQHDIELKLGLADFLSLDLTKIFYFKQEAKYYMINKVSFKEGELSKAECVAVIPYIQRNITITSLSLGVINFTYSGFDTNFLVFEYNRNNTYWVAENMPSQSPQTFTLPVNSGTYNIRLRFENTYSNIFTLTF